MSGVPALAESEYINFDDIKRFIKRYALTIASSMLVALVLATLYVLFAVPLYTARAQIVIDPSIPQLLRETGGQRLVSLDSAQVESQLAVLRSENIATAVIDKLDLERDPAFEDTGVSLRGLTSRLFSQSSSASNDSVSDFVKARLTNYRFQSGLDVRRVGISYAINISFTSPSPQLAATIANATAEAYIKEVIAAKARAANQGSRWLEQRIDELRKQMNTAALNVQTFRARRDYRIATKRNGSRHSNATATKGREEVRSQTSIEELETQAQTYRRIYESYLLAYTEAVLKQSYPVSNARVITPASRPLSESHPRTKLIVAFGVLVGCLAGFGIALIRNGLDRSVRDSRQIREEIGVEHLGNIPLMHVGQSRNSFLRAMFGSKIPKTRLTTVTDLPFSGFSHGVKRLKAAISLAGRSAPLRCIGIASACPNEGKTTIAANLAELFAKTGKRTLIIDCDLRTSSLSHQLGSQSEHGILEAINGSVDVEKCIVRANDSGLDLMPATDSETAVLSGELLGSERMRLLLQRLGNIYEVIIVDMPPLAAVVDGLGIGSVLDSVVLVAEWGATPIPVLSEVARSLRNAHVEILGAVINKVDPSNSTYGKPHSQYLAYVS
jgi:capsular exopolysaccharide synthesis family protein